MVHIQVLWLIRASVIFVLVLQGDTDQTLPEICVFEAGCFSGKLVQGFQVSQFEAYEGIPYAEKPERFEPAVPFRHNGSVKNELKMDCIQKNYLLPDAPITGDEDCLYLNIYRPQDLNHTVPVLVYLFGNGFFTGSSNPNFTGPHYIIDSGDIMLVTVSYRLGPFGFLATDDGVIPGNLGLKDQSLALRWVFRNIATFNGDQFRIVLMGHSGGAISAHMHMFSELSRHSFYAIIAISGTANVPFAIDDDPETTTRETAKFCNITDADEMDTDQLKIALQNVSPQTLLNAGDGLKYFDIDNVFNYRAMVEEDSPEAFLTADPKEYIQTGHYTPVPILFGNVPNEGGFRVAAIMSSPKTLIDFEAKSIKLLTALMEYPDEFTHRDIIDATNELIEEYIGDPKQFNQYNRQGFTDLLTHRFFYHPLYDAVRWHVHYKDPEKYPVYMYNFNYLGPYTFADQYTIYDTYHQYGIIHCDDFFFLFNAKAIYPQYAITSAEAKALKVYVDEIVYFAHNREPKHDLIPCNKSSFFPRDGKICDYIQFTKGKDGVMKVKTNNEFETKRMEIWDKILADRPYGR